jgi:hypothetical protein
LIFSHRYMRKQTINWYLLILGKLNLERNEIENLIPFMSFE